MGCFMQWFTLFSSVQSSENSCIACRDRSILWSEFCNTHRHGSADCAIPYCIWNSLQWQVLIISNLRNYYGIWNLTMSSTWKLTFVYSLWIHNLIWWGSVRHGNLYTKISCDDTKTIISWCVGLCWWQLDLDILISKF